MAFSLKTNANLIGVGALVIVAGYIAYDLSHTESVLPCAGNYPSPVSLDLKSDGDAVLSPVALQARSGSQDWGLLEKLETERDAGAPTSTNLKVALTQYDVSSSLNEKRGIGFPWRPSRLDGADAVCFSYAVSFSDNFDFTAGGILPGLVATPEMGVAEPTDAFSDEEVSEESVPLRAHIGWSETGHAQLISFDASGQNRNLRNVLPGSKPLKTGRWHQMAAEIKLNDIGKSNGVARLWVDGELALERTNLRWRLAPDQTFNSILYHISHGTPFGSGVSEPSSDGVVKVTPLELSWR